MTTSVALVTLGCARNEVDSEELAGRLEAGGFRLVDDPADADTVVVNTCGFVEAAKKDSVDTLLEAADLKAPGRPRPSSPWAAWPSGTARTSPSALPEADAVLGFDDYPDIAARLRSIVAGEPTRPAHPRDRRRLLPITPVERDAGDVRRARSPGHAPASLRRRLDKGPDGARSSSPAAATGAAPSAPSRASAAPSSAAARATSCTRPGGWPPRACASSSWSARTPRPTARTSATCGCWRRCCPSSPPSTASSGCGCPTSSPPRPAPA